MPSCGSERTPYYSHTPTRIGIPSVMGQQHPHHDVLSNLNPQHRALRQMIPGGYAGFGEMSKAAMGSGALDVKFKELIALAIGVVHGCDGCIASHAKAAVRAGASKEEAAEALASAS